jgi:putative sigma-54 modulation protein
MTNSADLSQKIIMQGVHVELTAALQNSIRDKLDPILRHDESIIRINVRLHQDQKIGTTHHYTGTAQVEIGGPDLVATADDNDAYAVVDKLAQKLAQLLARRTARRKDKRNHPQSVELDAAIPKTN